MQRLTEEFNAVGFYLSGHPLDECRAELQRAASTSAMREHP